MKFYSLSSQYKGKKRVFTFDDSRTLIYSKDNSVGKSTLLRMLFYSLGYPIPGTSSINFSKLILEVDILTSKGNIKVSRENDKLKYIENNQQKDYLLPQEHNQVLSKIFNTDEKRVLDNILGAVYLDQDKGWTLLNRGKVIGDIAFNIETLIEGLTNSNVEDLKQRLNFQIKQKEKYRGLKAISSYKATLVESDIQTPRSETKILTDQLVMLGSKKQIVENQLKEVNISLNRNKKSMELIEKMKIEVQIEGTDETIPVNKDTVVNYDSTYNYLDARKWLLKEEIAKIIADIEKNRIDLINLSGQEDLLHDENASKRTDAIIGQIEINEEEVSYHIEMLNSEIKSLKERIDFILSQNTDVIDNINSYILDYSSQLGVNEYIENKKNFLFTNKLKGFSGTVLHNLVFSYKLSYVKAIQNYLGIHLPIILDSPSGREVTMENVEEMFKILDKDFSDNQIIIASIHNSPVFMIDKTIELTKEEKIFEGPNDDGVMELF